MERKVIRQGLAFITILLVLIPIYKFFYFIINEKWFNRVQVTNDISPFDVFDLILTTTVTIVLAWFVTKKFTESRYKKEFVINDLKSIEEQINNIEKLAILESRIDLQNQLYNLQLLNSTIEKLKYSMILMDLECQQINRLDFYFQLLFQETTNVDGNEVDFSELNRIELDNCCRHFILVIREIICHINRH